MITETICPVSLALVVPGDYTSGEPKQQERRAELSWPIVVLTTERFGAKKAVMVIREN